MAAIDVGPGATDREAYTTQNNTYITLDNPANATGQIGSFELWFNAAYGDGGGVKAGTFYGSGTSYTNRDYELIGTVTAGSKQTFSGLNCGITIGDFTGAHWVGGKIEAGADGQGYYKSGDQFGTGVQTYIDWGAQTISIYGTGTTVVVTITGLVTLSGVGVSGAIVRLIKQSTNTVVASTTTDVNGNYSISYLEASVNYHVIVEYESGGIKYNALSLWDVQALT